jgi:hypothetical protein
MLRSCFGESANRYPSPQKWADHAAAYILHFNSRDNGKSQSIR